VHKVQCWFLLRFRPGLGTCCRIGIRQGSGIAARIWKVGLAPCASTDQTLPDAGEERQPRNAAQAKTECVAYAGVRQNQQRTLFWPHPQPPGHTAGNFQNGDMASTLASSNCHQSTPPDAT
jgi:hypothetical protein